MKKLLALLLTVCLLLASVPVMAEATVSGTWYLVAMGLTVATFELNEDGTCAVTKSVDVEEQKSEGTWAMEGNEVAITIEDGTQVFVYDGTEMHLNGEGANPVGLDVSSMLGAALDQSALLNLVKISREPGKATMAEFSAYQANGTVPEGKTKEDMDAAQEMLVASFLSVLNLSEFVEEKVSGTWYLVALDVTSSILELNEDGTCVTTNAQNGEKQEGTWNQEGDKVIIVTPAETLSLVYDGGKLAYGEEYTGEIAEYQSAGLMRFSREPGVVNAAEFNAYLADGTLPEGKTKEDMEALEESMKSSLMSLMENRTDNTEQQ